MQFGEDPCPINPSFDGLSVDWQPLCYVNPPYKDVKLWIEKALYEIDQGHTFLAIFLVFARTDTKWFQDLIYGKHAYQFVRRRIKFGEGKTDAPFPSMVVYITKKINE